MGPSDGELMERWRQGDALAFEALVRRWQAPLARLLGRLVGPSGPVPDLCQEVFLRVYQAQARYRENGAFAAWLYRIALNVARDAGRQRRRAPASLEGEPVDRRDTVEAACQEREAAERIAQAVAELPEALRVVLVLHHYEKLNFEQIARLTGAPASTVKSRFAAALGRLRLRLHQLGYGPEEAS
jgi:RNA polymerase sigma-70 factor (ECF subfamily)